LEEKILYLNSDPSPRYVSFSGSDENSLSERECRPEPKRLLSRDNYGLFVAHFMIVGHMAGRSKYWHMAKIKQLNNIIQNRALNWRVSKVKIQARYYQIL